MLISNISFCSSVLSDQVPKLKRGKQFLLPLSSLRELSIQRIELTTKFKFMISN